MQQSDCKFNYQMASFFSGTSGILLPYKNKTFYPVEWQAKSRLEVYGLLHNSVEVNSTFYKIPRVHTIVRWATEVPRDFRFTFKLWKGITHNKSLHFDEADVRLFMETINGIDTNRGCLLIQLPPSTGFACVAQLDRLLSCISDLNTAGWRVCVEFRNRTWHRSECVELLSAYGASLVLHDKGGMGVDIDQAVGDTVYLRFHGPDGNYRSSYDEAFLKEYSLYIAGWLAEGKEVYVYFNNTIGDALANLNLLVAYVDEEWPAGRGGAPTGAI
jgi:uncharacterized protein YecE (DUF72 family)